MAPLPPLTLTQTSPGIYETRWTLPADIPPGTYELVAVEILGGFRLGATPPGALIILPAVVPPGRPPAPPLPGPPRPAPTPPPAPGPPPAPVRRPGVDFGWADPRETLVQTPLWVTPDDTLIVGARTSLAGQVLAVTARIWQPNGAVVQAQQLFRPTADRTVQTTSLRLSYGYMTTAQVVVTSAGQSPQRGQCFVSLRLAFGSMTTPLTQQLLGMDYITGQKPIGWPGGRVLDTVEFPGWGFQQQGGAVPAGADFNFTVPFATRWRVRGMSARLVTSAVPGNRTVGAQTIGLFLMTVRIIGTVNQLASQTIDYQWIPGLNIATKTDATGIDDFIPADLVINDGTTIGSKTVGLLAGDQWSQMKLWVEEILEDTTGGVVG